MATREFSTFLKLPFRFGRWYDKTLKAHPLKTKMITVFFMTGTADIISQFIGKGVFLVYGLINYIILL